LSNQIGFILEALGLGKDLLCLKKQLFFTYLKQAIFKRALGADGNTI
jgi:hypothetical protein